jgi:hypothetical protein
MVDDSSGKIDLRGSFAGESVARDKAARKIFRRGKAASFADEGGVQVHANQFDTLRGKRSACREPANYVANSAAHVDDAYRSAKTLRTKRGNKWHKQLANPVAMEKFLGQALHFPMDGQQELVDGKWSRKPSRSGMARTAARAF